MDLLDTKVYSLIGDDGFVQIEGFLQLRVHWVPWEGASY